MQHEGTKTRRDNPVPARTMGFCATVRRRARLGSASVLHRAHELAYAEDCFGDRGGGGVVAVVDPLALADAPRGHRAGCLFDDEPRDFVLARGLRALLFGGVAG